MNINALRKFDCTSRDFVATRALREESMLEALGSGWIVPCISDGCRGLVVAADRMPTSRGATGSPADVMFRGLATALVWVFSTNHAEVRGSSSSPLTVVVDARYISLVSLEALLRQQLVEKLLEQLAAHMKHETGDRKKMAPPLKIIVLHRVVDVLAEPVLKTAASRILREAAQSFSWCHAELASAVDIGFFGAAEVLPHQCKGDLLTNKVLQVALSDDGALFLDWWDRLWAVVCREGSEGSAFRPSSSPARSASRRSRSQSSVREDGGVEATQSYLLSQSSSMLLNWQSTLHRALHEYIPVRDVMVAEEARERVQLYFWHLHDLQCIEHQLSPARMVQWYQATAQVGDDEGHLRNSLITQEAQARRGIVDDMMEAEETVAHNVAQQVKFGASEGTARRVIESHERRFRDLATTLRDPTEATLQIVTTAAPRMEQSDIMAMRPLFPVDLLPQVASLLLFGRDVPDEKHNLSSSTITVVDHGTDEDDSSFARNRQETPMRSYVVTDNGSQTASPVDPAPRISGLSPSLKRALSRASPLQSYRSREASPSAAQLSSSASPLFENNESLTIKTCSSAYFSPSSHRASSRRIERRANHDDSAQEAFVNDATVDGAQLVDESCGADDDDAAQREEEAKQGSVLFGSTPEEEALKSLSTPFTSSCAASNATPSRMVTEDF